MSPRRAACTGLLLASFIISSNPSSAGECSATVDDGETFQLCSADGVNETCSPDGAAPVSCSACDEGLSVFEQGAGGQCAVNCTGVPADNKSINCSAFNQGSTFIESAVCECVDGVAEVRCVQKAILSFPIPGAPTLARLLLLTLLGVTTLVLMRLGAFKTY